MNTLLLSSKVTEVMTEGGGREKFKEKKNRMTFNIIHKNSLIAGVKAILQQIQ